MAATAAASRTASPARRPRAARPAASPTLRRARSNTGRLVPVAVGRTAVAVGGLADSGLVHRLTRGRLWIGLLATLLVGIVGLNVMSLSFSASSSKAARAADELERQNTALRAKLASQLSSEELQQTAAKLDLIVPEPGAIGYLDPSPDDAATAAQRLRNGELTVADASAVPVVTETATAPVAGDPAAADPATTDPAASTAEPTAPPTDQAATTQATPATAAAGGVPAP